MKQKPKSDRASAPLVYRFGWVTLTLIMVLTAYGGGMDLADIGPEPRSQGIAPPSIGQIAVRPTVSKLAHRAYAEPSGSPNKSGTGSGAVSALADAETAVGAAVLDGFAAGGDFGQGNQIGGPRRV